MKIVCFLLLISLTGCSLIDRLSPSTAQDDVEDATGTTDAVEGKTEPDSASILEKLRPREDPTPGDPNWTPLAPQAAPELYTASTGSLFNVAKVQDYYSDIKPRQIGDVVTVLLQENTQASKTASSDTAKANDLSLTPIEVGGQEIKLGERNFSYSLTNTNKTSGANNANQSNSIQGAISVEVINVLANGNLVVRGEKWLTLNTGDEYVRLSGTIRPQDISADNTIASTRISNARIQYSATGDRQDLQQQSWLARFFNIIL
ncbi:MAG: flagellar basal body L-ring protein FlgH [Vibrionaceae bacterium]